MGDDAFSYEDLPLTIGTVKTVGDIYPSGSDQTGVRLISGSGQTSLVQTESDPNQINVDPETGADLPSETGVGFSGPYAEYIQSGVYNNQFIYAPPIPVVPLDDANPLPYWTTGGNLTDITIEWNDNGNDNPYLSFTGTFTAAGSAYIEQVLPARGSTYSSRMFWPQVTFQGTGNWTTSNDAGFVEATFLTETGAITGSFYSQNSQMPSGGTAGILRGTNLAALDTPADAQYVRLRVGVKTVGSVRAALVFKVYEIKMVQSVETALIRTPADASTSNVLYLTVDGDANLRRSDGYNLSYIIPSTALVPLCFILVNIVTSSTEYMQLSDNAGNQFTPRYAMPWGGQVVGLTWRINGDITAGGATNALSIKVYQGTNLIWTPVTIGSDTTTASGASGYIAIKRDGNSPGSGATFTAGQNLSVQITTTGTYAPTTLDMTCILWLALDYKEIAVTG